MRIENTRTDIVSHKRYEKYQLIRLVKNIDGVHIDAEQNMPGRGVYILKDLHTIQKCKKTLSIAFKCEIDDFLLDELSKQL